MIVQWSRQGNHLWQHLVNKRTYVNLICENVLRSCDDGKVNYNVMVDIFILEQFLEHWNVSGSGAEDLTNCYNFSHITDVTDCNGPDKS